QRLALVTELAVIIVLDDDSIGALGPLQQRQTPRQRQNCSRRQLVGRGNKRQTSALRQPRRIESLAIDSHCMQPSSSGAERLSCSLIMRLFYSNGISGVEQDTCCQVKRLLRAVDYDHLGSVAEDGSRSSQMINDGLSQGEASRGRTVVQLT